MVSGMASGGQVIAALHRDGACVLLNAVSDECVDACIAEMTPYLDDEATYTVGSTFLGKQTRRAGAVVARSSASWDMVAHPMLMGIVEGVVQHQVCNMTKQQVKQQTSFKSGQFTAQINLTQIIHRGAKQENQPLHRDSAAWPPIVANNMALEISTIWVRTAGV